MLSFKNLLVCLLAGSSAAFAVQQPQSPLMKRTPALRMSGGADAVPDLKVSSMD